MIPEIKAQWVAALRSGEYVQGHDNLTTRVEGEPDKDCCLGVLCKLGIKAGLQLDVRTSAKHPGVVLYDSNSGVLPYAVMQWAGLDTAIPQVEYFGRKLGVASLNDGANIYDEDCSWNLLEKKEPMDFLQIADVIEDQV